VTPRRLDEPEDGHSREDRGTGPTPTAGPGGPTPPATPGAEQAGPTPDSAAAPDPGEPEAGEALDLARDAPLHELSRDALSAFLYVALLPDEALALVRQLGLSVPGFRPESLGDVERTDLLADEIRAHPPSRAPVLEVLRRGLKEPAFATSSLDPAAADELLEVAGSDHGLAIALWRLAADPSAEVRARGEEALGRLAEEWFGPVEPAGQPAEAPEGGGPGAGRTAGVDGGRAQGAEARATRAEARAANAEADSRRAEARVEAERQRGEATRDKLQTQLKEARADAARAVDEAARARSAAEVARAAQARAEAELLSARPGDVAAEAARLRASLRDAEIRLHAAEARASRAEEREEVVKEALAVARAPSEEAKVAQAIPSLPGAADEVEDAPATWLLPVFTPEFYASLGGWDRRIQRAALKQAFLLSQDYRHPSLRALPLEGLPGYYRVRVATDVRLIYRRGDRQDAVEICSLIDREDLDRYVRQAKTR
jgi:mRNA-degrading endonuclease RelE of RelBE toxin-antitoxin system